MRWRERAAGGAAAAAMAALVLSGCGSQATEPTAAPTVTVAPTTSAPSPSSSAPAPAPTPSPTGTVTVTASPVPTTTADADPGRPAGQCADSDVSVTIRTSPGGGGLGSSDYDVVFTNTGGETCRLRGTPGVSVVAGDGGAQQGPAADRVQGDVKTLTLQAGDTVYAHLRVTNISPGGGPLDGCTVVKGRGYRVYPPHSKRGYFVEDPRAVACKDGPVFMSVDPVSRTAV